MSVSLIIPTLNEESRLAATLQQLRQLRPQEIIVADGGSTDGTRAAAAEADLFVPAPRGRASQMNTGAARTSGDVLLFLHADCTLEAGALTEVERWLRRPGVIAGCFTMSVPAAGRLYRLIEDCASARVRLTGVAYGDQGLFLRRRDFLRLGGFPPLHFMEDVFFSHRLCRHGRVVIARARIVVSPRRWQRDGVVRQTLRNWALTALAASGVPPDRLATLYPVVR